MKNDLTAQRIYHGISLDPSVPIIPASTLLSIPSYRPRRNPCQKALDPFPEKSYGESIIQKTPGHIRLFFQNVKGLSSSSGKEDYRYYMHCLKSLQVDIAGLSETNTCWSHTHLQHEFRSVVRKYYPQNKVSFGSPSVSCDPLQLTDTFQAGGNLSIVTGNLASRLDGPTIMDKTGLGRWHGVTLAGQHGQKLTIITAYRVCSGSVKTASMGSAFYREHDYFHSSTQKTVNPRRLFLRDLQELINTLQSSGHAIIVMLDANATIDSDPAFADFIESCMLSDFHAEDPAPSTFIGAPNRRIDFILGCEQAKDMLRRSGTLGYIEGPQSDHRSLFVDLHIDFVSGGDEKVAKSASRSLYTGNPELVSAYNSTVLRYYADHRMTERIDELFTNFRSMTRDDIRQKLISLDNDQGRAMRMGEKTVTRPDKPHQWSPELRNLAFLRLYWKLRLRQAQHSADYLSTFNRWQENIRQRDPTFQFPYLSQSMSVDAIRAEFNKASKRFRECQKNSESFRTKCYDDLLDQYENDPNPDTKQESQRKAKIVRTTIDGEVTRNKFRDIRRIVRPTAASSLSKILIPRLPGSLEPTPSFETYRLLQETPADDLIWETVVERDQIERHLLDYNRESFRAASESPLGHGVIHDALTFSSLSPSAIGILDGEIPQDWHQDDTVLREFLASFTIPDSVKQQGEIPIDISDAELCRGFKSWRETTATSPSGRHLGHYKAIIQEPTLRSFLLKFLNITIQSGISIPRWSNAVNVLIEKDPGKPRINRLRIIHLFEADLNFFLKLQWGHRLVRRAIDLNLLHDGQHGSIPRRMALDPIMLTQLTTDLVRVLKHDFARFDNDASSCYDRIIVALGMLAARKCGMPKNAIKTHADALAFMRYTVKTVYGVSEESYRGTVFEPLFGTGQGSGASPAVWLSLVVILLQTLDRLIPDRVNFSCPSGTITHQRLADAFVDDTALCFTSSADETSFEQLVAKLQRIAQTWEHLLSLSGGKLNLSKCSWYIIRWEWEKGRPIIRPISPTDPDIQLSHGSQKDILHTIRRSKTEESHRMLGVMLNPMGHFGDHLRFLKDKANTFASRLMSPRLTANDVRIFHRTTYIPSMRYGLASLATDEETLGNIQSKVIQAMLKKLHVQSTIPTAIRHGPHEFGGLELYDLRTESGIESLKYCRDALYSGSETGKLIRLNLHASQLEAGIGLPLLQNPDIPVPYLTPTWILSLRQFLYCQNMSLTVTDAPTVKLRNTADQYIMQNEHLARYSSAQQRDINLVRMYLQVQTLADMSDHDRPNRISLNYIDAARPNGFISDPQWPRQAIPSPQQRRLWKGYIRSSFLRYVPYWKASPLPSSTPPPEAAAISIIPTSDQLFAYLSTLPKYHRRLMDDLQQKATDDQIWKAFQSRRRLHVATDGGLLHATGTHGWVISTRSKVLFTCAGPVDGPFDTASSTRSELAGCASATYFVSCLSRFWGVKHKCRFLWYCDSKAAISRIRRHASRSSYCTRLPHDADLLAIIRHSKQNIRASFTSVWVKGHQDSRNLRAPISLAASLNIQADHLATAYRHSGACRSIQTVPHIDDQQCSILINGVRLTSQYDESVRFHVNGYHLKQYTMSSNGWSNETWNEVDFGVFGSHFRRLSPNQQAFQMKLVHNQLPLGARRYRQAPIKVDSLKLCPCCATHSEDDKHLMTCQCNPGRKSAMSTLKNEICTNDIHPVRHLLHAGIYHWLTTPHDPYTPPVSEFPLHMQTTIREALATQARIGWHQALKGYFSKQWLLLATMDIHNRTSSDFQRGNARMRSIIQSVQRFTKQIWLSRNSALHVTDDAAMKNIRSSETAQIRHYHENPSLLVFADRHLCSRSLPKLLAGSASTRRRWLHRVKLSISEAEREGTRQPLITSFLSTNR